MNTTELTQVQQAHRAGRMIERSLTIDKLRALEGQWQGTVDDLIKELFGTKPLAVTSLEEN